MTVAGGMQIDSPISQMMGSLVMGWSWWAFLGEMVGGWDGVDSLRDVASALVSHRGRLLGPMRGLSSARM